jgi:RNA polymerase sigma-70 factor (sigma-E family)
MIAGVPGESAFFRRNQPFDVLARLTHSMNRNDFDHFVTDSIDDLVRTAYLIVWDRAEAEDLVQETLLKVAKHWPKVSRMDYPVAYARRILVNLALDTKPKRTRQRAELSEIQPVETVLSDSGSAPGDDLHDALLALPARQRAVIVLRYFLDLSEADVAAALGCSLGTVKSTGSRGLARLQETLRPTHLTRRIAL